MDRKYRKRNNGKRENKLTEKDVVNYIDEFFKKIEFSENRASSSELNSNSELLQSIIDKFYKIFQLWDESGQRSINKNMFEPIYVSMSNVFNDHPNESNGKYSDDVLFSLNCKICGNVFPLRNRNCTYSFQYHETSKDHIDFIKKNLNVPTPGTGDVMETETAPAKNYHFEAIFCYARCYLCSEHITFDESQSGDCVRAHLRAPNHRNNCILFQNNQKYIKIVDLKKNVFKCKLCDQTLLIDELVQHFIGVVHRKLANVDESIDHFIENMQMT